MYLSGQFVLSVFTELDIFIQFGNRTGILMSNGETVLQPSEGCTDREIWKFCENGWRDLTYLARIRLDLFCAWSMFGKLCLN